jgi:hypothetical protein
MNRAQRRAQRLTTKRAQEKRLTRPVTPAERDSAHTLPSGRVVNGHDMRRALEHLDRVDPTARAYVVAGLSSDENRKKLAVYRVIEKALEQATPHPSADLEP